jgi:chromosome segregation ATPase
LKKPCDDDWQEMHEKYIALQRENSELTSSFKTMQTTSTQISERSRRNEDALIKSQQGLIDAQSLVQDTERALEDEKRAKSLLQTELTRVKELWNLEKNRRNESDLRLKTAEDQNAVNAASARKMDEAIKVLEENLRQRDIEILDTGQRADRSNAQSLEFQVIIEHLQHDVEILRQEKAKWLDERHALRRAVTELEYTVRAESDSRVRTGHSLTENHNPQDKTSLANYVSFAQRIHTVVSQIKEMKLEYADAVSINQELDNKYLGLMNSNHFFRHRIEDTQDLMASLVSELRQLSGETEDILQESDRIQSSAFLQTSRNLISIDTLEKRLVEYEAQLKANAETIKDLTRARDEYRASVEHCERSRQLAEEDAAATMVKSTILQSSLEKAEASSVRAATESDLLRGTINELERQYKELQAHAKRCTDDLAEELRDAKKDGLRLNSELSEVRMLHMASITDAESKEAARLVATKQRDDAEKRLREIQVQMDELDAELRSAEKEKVTVVTTLEARAAAQTRRIQTLEQNQISLSEKMNEAIQALKESKNTTKGLQGELEDFHAAHEKILAENLDANRQLAELHSDLVEMRRSLSEKSTEIENFETINEGLYSEKTLACEEVARLNQEYREAKQNEAQLIAQLAEVRLEYRSTERMLREKEELADRLAEEFNRCRQQLAEMALHSSELRVDLVQLQLDFDENANHLSQTEAELKSLREQFSEVVAQNADLKGQQMLLSEKLKEMERGDIEKTDRIQVLDTEVTALQSEKESSGMAVTSLTQANANLGQRNQDLEAGLDELLGKLHEAQAQNLKVTNELFSREAMIISLRDQLQSMEFQKSCDDESLKTSQQKCQDEIKARGVAEDMAVEQAREIKKLKNLVTNTEESWQKKLLATENLWNERLVDSEANLKAMSESIDAAKTLAKEKMDKCTTLTQSNHLLTEELKKFQQDLHVAHTQNRALQESLEESKHILVESKKELEESLYTTKKAYDAEQTQNQQVHSELQKVTRQRDRLREEFLALSTKYRALMTESDKLANTLDRDSHNRLAQTIQAGETISQNMEKSRVEFEDDMLRIALELKDLMHHQYDQSFQSPGSENVNFTPDRRSLYKSIADCAVDPREEIKAIATLGIARDRIKGLEECLSEREHELAQSTNTLAQARVKQDEMEAELLSSQQKRAVLEQEIQALTEDQRKMHAETIKLSTDYEHAKRLLESRSEELEIQKQAVADAMRELKAEQEKVLCAAVRDGTLSVEMSGLRNDYHDAMEAYKVSELRWTKKVLETETSLAESVESAKLHLSNCRSLELSKNELETKLSAKLNEATRAYQESLQHHQESKASWDEQMLNVHKRLEDALQESQKMREQNEDAKLAHKGLIVQLEEHESELAAAKIQIEKLTNAEKRMEEKASSDEKTIEDLKHKVKSSEQQISELEKALEKVQGSCRHHCSRLEELDEEVCSLNKSVEDRDLNLEKMTSAYQDLTHRFDLCLRREMDAVKKIDSMQLTLEEQAAHSERLKSQLEISEEKVSAGAAANTQLQDILSQHAHLLVVFSNDLEMTQMQVDALGQAMGKKTADFESVQSLLRSTKETLRARESEVQTLKDEVLYLRHEAEADDLSLRAEREKMKQVDADNMAIQKYSALLEEQIQSLNGFIAAHEQDKEDMKSDVEQLKLSQQSDGVVIHSLRQEISQLRGELSECDSDRLMLSIQCQDYAQGDDKVCSALEAITSFVQHLGDLVDSIHAKSLVNSAQSRRMLDEMEMGLQLLQPVIDEVTYCTADISHLRDGHRAWLKTEKKLEHQMNVNSSLQEEHSKLLRDNETLKTLNLSQERVITGLREQLVDLHNTSVWHATEKGQLKESLSILEQVQLKSQNETLHLQERLATVENDLDNATMQRKSENEQFEEKISILQAQVHQYALESERVHDSLCELETITMSLVRILSTSRDRMVNNHSSVCDTVGMLEKLVENLCHVLGPVESQSDQRTSMLPTPITPARPTSHRPSVIRSSVSTQFRPPSPRTPRFFALSPIVPSRLPVLRAPAVRGQASSVASEVSMLIRNLTSSRDQVTSMKLQYNLVEERLQQEQEERRRSDIALAEATHRVNELQAAVQDLNKELSGKKRLIAYLEEQHSSLHGSLTAHQVYLKEKEAIIQNMDISWLQDKSQLMRKESELERISSHLAESMQAINEGRECNSDMNNVIAGLERDLETLCAAIDSVVLQCSDILSLRDDRRNLNLVQHLLEQEESKVSVFREVLSTLQENHRDLESSHNETIQQLEDQAKLSDLFKKELERKEAEVVVLSKQLAFLIQRDHFYASESEEKIHALENSFMNLNEIVQLVCKNTQDLPELRNTIKFSRGLESLLHTTEQSLHNERKWNRDKNAELDEAKRSLHELEDRFVNKSLQTEKLEKHVNELSAMASVLQHDLLELQNRAEVDFTISVQIEEQLMNAISISDDAFLTLSDAKRFQDNYCHVLQSLSKDNTASASVSQSPKVLKDVFTKFSGMQDEILELQRANMELSESLAQAVDQNEKYKAISLNHKTRVDHLSSDLASKEKLVSVMQVQMETLQDLMTSTVTEKDKIVGSLHSEKSEMQSKVESMESKIKESHEIINKTNDVHATLGIGLDDQIEIIDSIMSEICKTKDMIWTASAKEHVLKNELKEERLTNSKLQSELLERNQLVGLLEKEIESLHVQMLHAEVGKSDVEKQALLASAMRHELHIAQLHIQEQRQVIDENSMENKMMLEKNRSCEAKLLKYEHSISWTETMILEIMAVISSVEVNLTNALSDSRRVRHETLKIMADNVGLRERLSSLEGQLEMTNLSLESATVLSMQENAAANLSNSILEKKVEELQNFNSEQQVMLFELRTELSDAKKQLSRADSLVLSVNRDSELQSIIIETIEAQLQSVSTSLLELRDNDERSQLQNQYQAHKKLLPILEDQIWSLQDHVSQREKENQKLVLEVSELQMVNGSQFVEISVLKSKFNECNKSIALLEQYKSNAESSERMVQLMSDKIAKLEEILLQSDTCVMALRFELQQSKDDLQHAKGLLGNWQGKTEAFGREKATASDVIDHLHEKVHVLQTQIAGHVFEKEALEMRVSAMNDINTDAQGQLQTIKQGIVLDRLEVASLQARNIHLEEQIADLTKVSESQKRLLDLTEKAAEANQQQLENAQRENVNLKIWLKTDAISTNSQIETMIMDIEKNLFALIDSLVRSLRETNTDNGYFRSVVARLEAEYEEEQQLSSMLQDQVQSLHAIVLQNEALKQGGLVNS